MREPTPHERAEMDADIRGTQEGCVLALGLCFLFWGAVTLLLMWWL